MNSLKTSYFCNHNVTATIYKFRVPQAKKEPGFLYFNISGGVIGYLSSIFGIGGGIFSVPLLKISGMEMKAVGTGAACAFPIAVISASSYLILGYGTNNLPEYSIGYIYLPGVLGITIFSFFAKLAHSSLTDLMINFYNSFCSTPYPCRYLLVFK